MDVLNLFISIGKCFFKPSKMFPKEVAFKMKIYEHLKI